MRNTFMKSGILLLSMAMGAMICRGQDLLQSELKPVLEEGKKIFQVEMAGRIAEKWFKPKYNGQDKLSGWVAYPDGDGMRVTFYTSRDKNPVLASVMVNKSMEDSTLQGEWNARALLPVEDELIQARKAAVKVCEDSAAFPLPEGTRFVFIPLKGDAEDMVYILTEPVSRHEVVFGNDFMLRFDSKKNLSAKMPLHKNMSSIPFDPDAGNANNSNSSHTMIPAAGDLVTSTDIAVLLLNQSQTHWSHHSFISENYIFFWNYQSGQMMAIAKGAPKTEK